MTTVNFSLPTHKINSPQASWRPYSSSSEQYMQLDTMRILRQTASSILETPFLNKCYEVQVIVPACLVAFKIGLFSKRQNQVGTYFFALYVTPTPFSLTIKL
jgi:hypothetical protein